MCHFYRTRHFSHFWGSDDSSPNVRLHTSSHDPHPTVTQTWSWSLPYTNYGGGIWRPPGSTWGSLTSICPMGLFSSFLSHRQKYECNASVLFCSLGITGRESSFEVLSCTRQKMGRLVMFFCSCRQLSSPPDSSPDSQEELYPFGSKLLLIAAVLLSKLMQSLQGKGWDLQF